jgi:hypothetical protein
MIVGKSDAVHRPLNFLGAEVLRQGSMTDTHDGGEVA